MKQLVYLGKSRTGKYGYFTNGILAWEISAEDYAKPAEWHKKNAPSICSIFMFMEGEE